MSVEETFRYAKGGGMNVGIIAMGWKPDIGGVPSHTADLARELALRGHQTFALCLDISGKQEPFTITDEVVDGVPVRRVSYGYADNFKLFDVLYHKQLNDVVLGWMAETPCDVIHVHHLSGFGAGALRAIDDVGQPLVMSLHDYWMLDPRGQLFRPDKTRREPYDPEALADDLRKTYPHLLPSGGADPTDPHGNTYDSDEAICKAFLDYALEMLSLPKQLMTASEATKSIFERAGVPQGRIQVVENGVDAGRLAEDVPRLKQQRPADEPVRLGVIGTVLPSKGVLELAQAFVALDHPELRLVIAGNMVPYHGDSSTIDAVRALAEEHPRIELRGEYSREELAPLLAELDGVAAPSRWEEVYGLTVREARAGGLPVLVSDIGALPAAAGGGQAGIVVDPDDPEAWKQALKQFADDHELRAKWAAHPAPVHTSRAMTLEFERIYANVVEQATGLRPTLPDDALTDGSQLAGDPSAGAQATAAGSEAGSAKAKGFFGRLFGRR